VSFTVLPETSALLQPGAGTFDYPAFWPDDNWVQFRACYYFHCGLGPRLDRFREGVTGVSSSNEDHRSRGETLGGE